MKIMLALAVCFCSASIANPTEKELQEFANSFVTSRTEPYADIESLRHQLIANPLLATGVIGFFKESMLHIAVKLNLPAVVALLIQHHANVNACMSRSVTPIFLAVEIGSSEIIRLLLRHGAELTVRNDRNETVVEFCARWNPTLVHLFTTPVVDDCPAGMEAAQLAAAIDLVAGLSPTLLSVSGTAADFGSQ